MNSRTLGASSHAGSWRQVRTLVCWTAALAAPAAARAQVITVKNAPIADGGQFSFLPSANTGMGGLSIALADSTLDPFVNPAKGVRLRGTRVFGAPTFFSVSRHSGGGLTLPVGVSASRGAWFSQFMLAFQDIDRGGEGQQIAVPPGIGLDARPITTIAPPVVDDRKISRQNGYGHATLGRRFGRGLSVAASGSWWGIHAIDGVELYYPTSQRVRQNGDALDLRLGLLQETKEGHSIEAVAVHNRRAVDNHVTFMDVFWDPNLRQVSFLPRMVPNADETETWGLHLAYSRPLADSGWRVGAILTGNQIRQPSLPAYDLPQVAGDAGNAQAFNIGGGFSRITGPMTLGVDAIFEPISSHTWVQARDAVETRSGTTLDAGTRTLDNRFRFTNGIVRAGAAVTFPFSSDRSLRIESGGQLRAIRYRLEQRDVMQNSRSRSTQHWNEWTRSWGAAFRFAGAELHYRGSLATGASRPGFDDQNGIVIDDLRPFTGTSSFVNVAPFGLTFGDVSATTHQVSFSIPIR
jgi:hypothetical protein